MALSSFSYLGARAFRWTIGDSVFETVPEIGARLTRWRAWDREVIYWPKDVSSEEFAFAYGGNPILFPFPARCFDRERPLYWRPEKGRLLPMPMHGIARQSTFVLNSFDEEGFTACLLPSPAANECYPYEYLFQVSYKFSGSGFLCEFTLENRDNCPIPWSAGHHFYFAIPFSPGLTRSDHYVRIHADKVCQVGLHTDGRVKSCPPFESEESLAHPTLREAMIHYDLRSNEAILYAKADAAIPRIVIRHEVEEKLWRSGLAFVTWSLDSNSPFYCVEPWMGASNTPENRIGLKWVFPGERSSHVVSVNCR